jgi:hypothetical protein
LAFKTFGPADFTSLLHAEILPSTSAAGDNIDFFTIAQPYCLVVCAILEKTKNFSRNTLDIWSEQFGASLRQ